MRLKLYKQRFCSLEAQWTVTFLLKFVKYRVGYMFYYQIIRPLVLNSRWRSRRALARGGQKKKEALLCIKRTAHWNIRPADKSTSDKAKLAGPH